MSSSSFESWLRSSPNTIAMHMKTPEIDLETYRRINRIELAHSVLRKTRIYLDTMVWIRFRDNVLGRSSDPAYGKLLDVLRDGCKTDQLICPLSYPSVTELLSQDDADTRRATARLMDELSSGVCIQPPHYLTGAELECWFYTTLPLVQGRYDPADFAWTRVVHWVGQPTLSADALTPAQLLAMQKAMDDTLTSLSTEVLADQMSSEERHQRFRQSNLDTVEAMNYGKVKPENQFNSYAEYVESEVWGGLEGLQEELGEVMTRVARATGHNGPVSSKEVSAAGGMLRSVIGTAFKLGRISKELPQVYISAALHAAVRFDRKRKYKATDLEDFRHAGSALPYCQVFVTEKSLAHLLRSPPLSLVEQYSCAVITDAAEAESHIRGLL